METTLQRHHQRLGLATVVLKPVDGARVEADLG